jgi:outer membrane protein assembly factor BamB
MFRHLAVTFGSLLWAASLGLVLSGLIWTPSTSAKDERPGGSPTGPYWPQWRGPHRDNISPDKGLLSEWPAEGPPLAWKHEGLGAGFSGVSIAHGRIYTMSDRDGKQRVLALPIDGGAELWNTVIGEPWDPDKYSGPRCTPAIDGDLVYVLGSHGDLVCLQAADGKEVWRRNFPKDFDGRMHSRWGFSESPLVDGDKLLCTPGGPQAGIVALDKRTGAEIWRSAIPNLGDKGSDGAPYASIVVSHGAGIKQYVQLMGRGVVGIAADGGKFLWGYNRVANNVANIPTPLIHEDYVFCSTGYGTGAVLLRLNASPAGVQADEVYFLEAKDLQNHHGGMVLIGDYIYLGHGHNAGAPTCLEWKTGKIVWRNPRGPGRESSAVTYADGNLYFRFQDGVMALVAATPEKYEERGMFQLPTSDKPSWPHPVVSGGNMYIREQDMLLCYDVKKK